MMQSLTIETTVEVLALTYLEVLQVVEPCPDPSCTHENIALQDFTAAWVHLCNAHAKNSVGIDRPRDCIETSITCIIILWPVFIAGQDSPNAFIGIPGQLKCVIPSFYAVLKALVPALGHRRVNIDSNLIVRQALEVILPNDRHHWINEFSGVHRGSVEPFCVHAYIKVILSEIRQPGVLYARGHWRCGGFDDREGDSLLNSVMIEK
mmetsp:Transcript_15399/g.27531  ORF Transcript_15399/g.27531 Transcript_15399/m.27531 type:complete len:207 (-) Transcript_15399:864-1484(-)